MSAIGFPNASSWRIYSIIKRSIWCHRRSRFFLQIDLHYQRYRLQRWLQRCTATPLYKQIWYHSCPMWGGTVRGDACTNVSKYHSNHPPITSWHLFKKYMKIDNRHLTDSKKVVYTLAININVNYVRNKCRWGCVNKIKDVSNGLHDLGQMRGNTKLQSLVPQYHHYSNECWRSRIPNIFVER